jgi:hypothetical protein
MTTTAGCGSEGHGVVVGEAQNAVEGAARRPESAAVGRLRVRLLRGPEEGQRLLVQQQGRL